MALPLYPLLAFPIAATLVVVPSVVAGLLAPTAGWAAMVMVVVSLVALWLVARRSRTMATFWIWLLPVGLSAVVWGVDLAYLRLMWRLGSEPEPMTVADLQRERPALPRYVTLSGVLRADYAHEATFRHTETHRNASPTSYTVRHCATPIVTADWRPRDAVEVLVTQCGWAERVRSVAVTGILDTPAERGGSLGADSLSWLEQKPPRFRWEPRSTLTLREGTTPANVGQRLWGDLAITLILLGVTWGIRRAVRADPAGEGKTVVVPQPQKRRSSGGSTAPVAATVAAPVAPAPAPPVPATSADWPEYRFGFEPIPEASSMTDLTLARRYPPGYVAQYDYPLELAAIGPHFDTLTALRRLTIDSDSLEELPASLSRLSHLESLIVRAPLLAGRLPDLSGLRGLTELRLTAGLPAVPPSIGSLANLRSLALPDNALTDLPALIANARDLRTLDLSRNQLESLPDAIGALTSLEQIDLRGNRFADLPPVLAGLPALKEVDLRDNPIPKARHRDLRAALGKPKKLLL